VGWLFVVDGLMAPTAAEAFRPKSDAFPNTTLLSSLFPALIAAKTRMHNNFKKKEKAWMHGNKFSAAAT